MKKQVSGSVEKVSDREERLLLTYRYLNNCTWEEIGEKLHVSNRTVHRIHASALKNLVRQQYRTIKGQAFAGDIQGAEKGLYKLLDRRYG